MSDREVCLKCDNTGIMADGSKCDCKLHGEVKVPIVFDIPSVYQSAVFSHNLVPIGLGNEYGVKLEEIIEYIDKKGKYDKNILICSPPNSGKTIFAYTIYRSLYTKSVPMPDIIDLIEAKEIISGNSYLESDIMIKNRLLKDSPVAIIKIPLDLPNKFAETISLIVERRVRNNGITIFLYGGDIQDLKNQDRFGALNGIIRDGSYNSVQVLNYGFDKRKDIR